MMSVMIVNLPLETVNFHTLLSCRWKGQLNRKVQKICNLQNTNVFFARVKQFEKTEHCIFVGKNRHSRAYKWKSYLMEPDNYSRNTKTSHSHRIRSLSQSPILLGQNPGSTWDDELSWNIWISSDFHWTIPRGFTWLCPTISFPSLEAQQSRSFSSRPDPDDGGRSEGTTLALP